MIRRWRRSGGAPIRRRRSGPSQEDRWWDPADQEIVEADLLVARDLGRGWRPVAMPNNVERLDPHGSGTASRQMRVVRERRRLTALDEGRAWRRRATGALLVLRAEMFAGDGSDHQHLWSQIGAEVLTETWRERWEARGREPGWIEARWESTTSPEGSRAGSVDRIRIEDHTGVGEEVLVYHHVTVWSGRFHGVLVLRLPLGEEDEVAVRGATDALIRAGISRRSDPDPGFV